MGFLVSKNCFPTKPQRSSVLLLSKGFPIRKGKRREDINHDGTWWAPIKEVTGLWPEEGVLGAIADRLAIASLEAGIGKSADGHVGFRWIEWTQGRAESEGRSTGKKTAGRVLRSVELQLELGYKFSKHRWEPVRTRVLSSIPDRRWEWGPEICVLTSLPRDSGAQATPSTRDQPRIGGQETRRPEEFAPSSPFSGEPVKLLSRSVILQGPSLKVYLKNSDCRV